MENTYYTIDELFDICFSITLDQPSTRECVTKTFEHIPADVVDMIKETTLILIPQYMGAEMIPTTLVKNNNIILISDSFMEKASFSELCFIIMHEVAHVALGHKSPLEMHFSYDCYLDQEKQADELAYSWWNKMPEEYRDNKDKPLIYKRVLFTNYNFNKDATGAFSEDEIEEARLLGLID